MNYFQNAKLTSYKLIVTEAKNNPNVPTLIPTFATGINRLEAITNEIGDIAIQQTKNITGVTDDKNVLLNNLCGCMLDVSGAVHSYAISKKDKILAAKVNYNESYIAKMSHANVITISGIVLEEAGKLAPEELANEGISTDEMDEFKDDYTRFKDVSSDSREAIIDRSGYTQRLADLFAEASDLKKNTLDRLATQFKRKDPDFYQKYQAASIVFYKRSAKTTPAPEASSTAKG
jgi:hypothetical protein